MPIYKKHRVISEKLTSIEDPIAVVQRGVISFAPSKGTTFLVPTNIQNPVNLKLQAMSEITSKVFMGASGWWCDLKLYCATNAASSGFGSLASITTLDEVGKRLRIYNGKLHVATASCYATSAENTELSALTTWRQLDEFGSNQQRYLVVNMPNAASATFKLKRQRLAYEVIGYEY